MDGLAVPGKLKLKKGAGGVTKKKSKKSFEEKMKKAVETSSASSSMVSSKIEPVEVKQPAKTAAEMAFERRQQELLTQKVMKNAQSSHRERVEKFNKYLENLVEINDIPKVSWTK